MSALFALAKPRRIKASHRRRRKVALGLFVQRYYDPVIGRFLSADPVIADGNTGANFNRYWYGNNNPYKFTDPDGRCPVCIGAGIGGLIGGGAEAYHEWKAGNGFSARSIGVETARGAVIGALTTLGGAGGAVMAKTAQLGVVGTTATEVGAASMTAGYATAATGPVSDVAKGLPAQSMQAHGAEAAAAVIGTATGGVVGKAVGGILAKTSIGQVVVGALARTAEEVTSAGVAEKAQSPTNVLKKK